MFFFTTYLSLPGQRRLTRYELNSLSLFDNNRLAKVRLFFELANYFQLFAFIEVGDDKGTNFDSSLYICGYHIRNRTLRRTTPHDAALFHRTDGAVTLFQQAVSSKPRSA